LLAHDAIQTLRGVHVAAGGVVRQRIAQDAGGFALGVVDVPQASEFGHATRVGVQPKVALQLAGEFFLQHAPRVVDEALQAVSGGLVEGHLPIALIAHREGHLNFGIEAELRFDLVELLNQRLDVCCRGYFARYGD